METVQKYTASMRESTSPKTTAELCSSPLCDNTMGESIAELRARISRLELQISSGSFTPVREDKHPTPAPAEEEPERYEPELPAAGEETSIQEEDDLDPSRCSWEEQPEDSFVQRGGRVEPEPRRTGSLCPKRTHRQGANMEGYLRKGGRCASDGYKAETGRQRPAFRKGKIENGTLRMERSPGFLYGRFNRQDVNSQSSRRRRQPLREKRYTLCSQSCTMSRAHSAVWTN